MNTNLSLTDIVLQGPVVAILTIDAVDDAVPLAQAMFDGGLRVMEVTLRTDQALEAIRRVVQAVPDMIVGAGTVLTADDITKARQAGAQFGVSPGLTSALGAAVKKSGWPFLPGVASGSEVMAAHEFGFDTVKFFPAENLGGAGMLKALAGPFPKIRFCPTGGITPKNAGDYLALPNVVCVGGSWPAPKDVVRNKDWATVTETVRKGLALMSEA